MAMAVVWKSRGHLRGTQHRAVQGEETLKGPSSMRAAQPGSETLGAGMQGSSFARAKARGPSSSRWLRAGPGAQVAQDGQDQGQEPLGA